MAKRRRSRSLGAVDPAGAGGATLLFVGGAALLLWLLLKPKASTQRSTGAKAGPEITPISVLPVFPTFTLVPTVVDALKLRGTQAGKDLEVAASTTSYESCRAYGGTKQECSENLSSASMEYCVFFDHKGESEEAIKAACAGKLANAVIIANDTRTYT